VDDNDQVLLVEGQDDKHVVRHLCLRNQPIPEFCISDKGGVDDLLKVIGAELRVPGRRAVGILVDADDDLNARWTAVADKLRQENIEVPFISPEPAGFIVDSSPRVGVWLMPDNRSPGELENFVLDMIPEDDRIWPRSREYIESIPFEDRKFIETKKPRATLFSWLATREDPRLMGSAIGTGDLRIDGPLTRTFVEWLRRLFE